MKDKLVCLLKPTLQAEVSRSPYVPSGELENCSPVGTYGDQETFNCRLLKARLKWETLFCGKTGIHVSEANFAYRKPENNDVFDLT